MIFHAVNPVPEPPTLVTSIVKEVEVGPGVTAEVNRPSTKLAPVTKVLATVGPDTQRTNVPAGIVASLNVSSEGLS